MASVRLEQVYKQYNNGFLAVKDFNLDIDNNEFVVLVGPSGCGKSTTLRMIAGLEEITSGSIFIDDVLVNDVEPKDRNVAMVFQNYALYPHMTVYENMGLGLKIKKVKKPDIKKRVMEAAEILGLTDFLKKKPRTLSGGQRQRVALGRAIVREPKVFLLDEPLSNLDAKLRSKMRTEIIKLHLKLATTFVYVTHDQVEAMTMGTKIVVMKDGEIQQIDTPQNIYEKPRNIFVAGFIGSPEMNFASVLLTKSESKTAVELGKYKFEFPKESVIDKALEKYSGKEVMMGFRPESICLWEEDNTYENQTKVNVKIEVSELLGSETLLYFALEGREVMAKIPQTLSVLPGQEMALLIEMDKVHLFDKDTQERIPIN